MIFYQEISALIHIKRPWIWTTTVHYSRSIHLSLLYEIATQHFLSFKGMKSSSKDDFSFASPVVCKNDTLSDENKQDLMIMLSQSEDLYTAWRLKENFKYFRRATTKQDAEQELLSRILEAEECELSEFIAATTAFHNWGRSIVNPVIYKYSNGITESFNNKIKVLKRNAYGYRNFDNFRKRIMLNCSKYGNLACSWLP